MTSTRRLANESQSTSSSLDEFKRIVAVIPAFDEEQSVGGVVEAVSHYVEKVLVVDDASDDSTGQRAREAGATVIWRKMNGGVASALQTGYDAAIAEGADLIIQLDADGQHDPSFIPVLLRALDDEVDIVIGSRFLAGSEHEYNLIRRWGIRTFSFLTEALGGSRILDVTSGFRVYRASALRRFPPCRGRHWAVEQTLFAMRSGLRMREVGVPIAPRRAGASQFGADVAALYPLRVVRGIMRALGATSGRAHDGQQGQ